MVDIVSARAGVEAGSEMVIGTLASFSARRVRKCRRGRENEKAARSRLRARSRIGRPCPDAPAFGAETVHGPPLGRGGLTSLLRRKINQKVQL
jgi:hypothetical protein